MKHKILLLLFLFSLLPSWGWGQEAGTPITINLKDHEEGYTIEQNGTYIFKGTHSGNPAQDIIGEKVKAVINVAEGLDVTIILDNVTIDFPQNIGCPLSAKDASKVNLILKGKNTLKPYSQCPGIWTPEKNNCGIIINEDIDNPGSLDIVVKEINTSYPCIGGFYKNTNSYINIKGGTIKVNSSGGTGIGSFENSKGGKITITGGTVDASGSTGPGIGSGPNGSGCEITIIGGTVTATSRFGAGIGSGENSTGSNITITGGTVTATSRSGAGIGSGESSSGSNITITGGTVTATSDLGAGIGDGYHFDTYTSSSTFSTGVSDGTAFINATGGSKSISDDTYRTNKTTKGLIFDGNEGYIYGDSYMLKADATIENGKIFTIKENQTLTINDGVKLANNGVISCKGKIVGTIENKNEIQYQVTYNFNYDDSPAIDTKFISHGGNISSHEVTRNFYTFDGWYDKPESGNKVEIITEAITVYAHWKPIPFTIKTSIDDITTTYGASFTKEFTANMFSADISNAGNLKSIELKELQTLPDDLSFNNSILSGTPTEVNESGTDITFVVTAGNGISKEAIIKFKVKKAELTITPHQDQKIYQDETPTYTVTGVVNNDQITFKGSLAVDKNEVIQGSLVLEESFVKNYDIKFTDRIPIEVLSGNASDVLAILPPPDGENYHEEVTFIAPEGFEIALVSSVTKSDAQLAYNNSFVWDKAGTHEVTYSLRRTAGNKKAYEHSVIVTVGKVSPPDVHPDKPDNTTPVTYKVSLPSVEGIHTNPVADNYDIEAWGSFKFTITIEEGYRMLSLPVVKVNDSEIAFSSRTDTTFTYIIEYIRTPKDIKITGIVKDPATANNAIKAPEENIKIINGVAYITVAKPTVFAVVDMNGNTISTNKLAPGETPIYNLPRAKPIVFWFDKERAVKVIIK